MSYSRPSVSGIAAVGALAALAACTSGQSEIQTTERLARPQMVLVDSFAVSPDEVRLDAGLSAEVEQAAKERRGTSRAEQEKEISRQVADAIADRLVLEIEDIGLEAQRGNALPQGVQNALLITGQVVSIDEGNRTERVIIGLGAGRSDVRVHAQLYELTPAGRQLIDRVEVDGRSGLTPGMAETMGAGALAGHLLVATAAGAGLHVMSETMGADVVADADRAAKGVAKQLAALYAEEGWKR
ncbi:MAG TPA: DUF4410 domain-containing protein [Geminicoccaceae bacterium]|nr:DUF4410 domain-containing protein [Geminicoccaceae bacterium]